MSCSFSTVDIVCGPTPYAPNELRVIPQKSRRKDVTDYLTTLGVSGNRGLGKRINEADVILNRAGLHSLLSRGRKRKDYRMSKAQLRINNTLPEIKIQSFSPISQR